MAVLLRYTPSGLTRDKYDAVNEALAGQGNAEPPQALRLHVLFGDEGNLRVSEIWESEDDWRQWYGQLQPAFQTAGVDMPEPELLAVHELWGTGVNPS